MLQQKKDRSKVEELFGADLRSLACFRIGLAVLIIFDLIIRGTSLRAHYTDFGILPRGALIDQFSPLWRISFHFMSGEFMIQLGLFLVAGIFALALLVGYQTRIATVLSWIMLTSLHARNPMILQAGDIFFHLLLFWGMFLPLGARASFDSFLKPPSQPLPRSFTSIATGAFFFQVAVIYWVSVAHKLHPNSFPIWGREGTAVYYAMHIDQFATPIAVFIRQFPWLMKCLNYFSLFVEACGPLLLFCPFATGIVRTLAVFLIIGMHLGFRLCLELGPFPWISSVAMLPFLPAFFWETLLKWLKPEALCSIVSRSVRWICSLGLLRPPICKNFWSPTFRHNTVAFFCIVYILTWNLGNVHAPLATPRFLLWFGTLFSLDQQWNMFSPPLRDDGWYVIPGKLRNGAVVDVFKEGGPVSWEKPARVSTQYPMERWRKYMMNLYGKKNAPHRLYYGKYLCRNWNSRHRKDLQLVEFELIFMRETTLPDYQPPKVQKMSLWHHWCFEVPKKAADRESTLGL